jgi:outer membrane PBP1 activator LpoA protein
VALLLPLSGAQRAVAEAIRDGFLAAYLADESAGVRPEIMILDEEQPSAAEAYRAAIADGADTIAGPLLKESVAQVAAVAGSVPTLTLNYTDAAGPVPAGFYQFSLAPEDEARQTAMRAASEGRLRAIALVPDSEWGRRMLNAFTSALEERGGKVLAYRLYDTGATDFTIPIQRLLLLDESRERQRRLSANLGVSLEFEPRRRSDVDCIFLAANAAAGRLIRPQLRFLYAGDVPTYATSAVYQAGARGDPDLDGVMFADAPAVLGSDPRAQALREGLVKRWPASALGRMRLFAMGYDAYSLVRPAPPVAGSLAGLSGWLSMDDAGRIHRELPWAEFRDGRVVPLPDVAPRDPAAALAPQ